MSKKKPNKKIIIPVLAFVAGVLITALVNNGIEDYFKRPRIKGSIDCINIIDDESNDLILNLYLQFENIGHTKTSISLDNLKLHFKNINEIPYSFKLDSKIEIAGLSFVYDTLKVILPRQLDTISNLPTIETLTLIYHEIKKGKRISIDKDSSDVIWSFMQGVHIPENPDSFSYHSDYVVKNGETRITGRKIPINYKGKTYTCILYPRDAHISYKVDNDMIHIVYGQELNIPKGINGYYDFLMKPLIFIPAPEIEDKCILPNGFEFSLRQEVIENAEIKYKNYSVRVKDMRDTRKQIVYFFK